MIPLALRYLPSIRLPHKNFFIISPLYLLSPFSLWSSATHTCMVLTHPPLARSPHPLNGLLWFFTCCPVFSTTLQVRLRYHFFWDVYIPIPSPLNHCLDASFKIKMTMCNTLTPHHSKPLYYVRLCLCIHNTFHHYISNMYKIIC